MNESKPGGIGPPGLLGRVWRGEGESGSGTAESFPSRSPVALPVSASSSRQSVRPRLFVCSATPCCTFSDSNMSGQDAFRKFTQQLQRAGGSGGRIPGGKGAFAGGGLLIALVGGGFLLNASLFNGAWQSSFLCRYPDVFAIPQLMVVTELSSTQGE